MNFQRSRIVQNIVSYGGIHTEMTLSVELKRNLGESEMTFINAFEENPATIATVTHFIFDKGQWRGRRPL